MVCKYVTGLVFGFMSCSECFLCPAQALRQHRKTLKSLLTWTLMLSSITFEYTRFTDKQRTLALFRHQTWRSERPAWSICCVECITMGCHIHPLNNETALMSKTSLITFSTIFNKHVQTQGVKNIEVQNLCLLGGPKRFWFSWSKMFGGQKCNNNSLKNENFYENITCGFRMTNVS